MCAERLVRSVNICHVVYDFRYWFARTTKMQSRWAAEAEKKSCEHCDCGAKEMEISPMHAVCVCVC